MKLKGILYSILLFSSLYSQTFKSGEYIMNDKATETFSILTINKIKNNTTYKIKTIGKDQNGCELSGTINNFNSKIIFDQETKESCNIKFNISEDGTLILSNNDLKKTNSFDTSNCVKMFCEENVSFEGEYIKTKNGCDQISIDKTREEFSKLYDDKDYEAASDKLSKILDNCELTLEDQFLNINDLALTQLKLKDRKECMDIYNPLMKYLTKSNEELLKDFGDKDYDNYIDYIKNSRYIYHSCSDLFN
jgi:hypothetical protein